MNLRNLNLRLLLPFLPSPLSFPFPIIKKNVDLNWNYIYKIEIDEIELRHCLRTRRQNINYI